MTPITKTPAFREAFPLQFRVCAGPLLHYQDCSDTVCPTKDETT